MANLINNWTDSFLEKIIFAAISLYVILYFPLFHLWYFIVYVIFCLVAKI